MYKMFCYALNEISDKIKWTKTMAIKPCLVNRNCLIIYIVFQSPWASNQFSSSYERLAPKVPPGATSRKGLHEDHAQIRHPPQEACCQVKVTYVRLRLRVRHFGTTKFVIIRGL